MPRQSRSKAAPSKETPYRKPADLNDDSRTYRIVESKCTPIHGGTEQVDVVQDYKRVPIGLQPNNKHFQNVTETRVTTTTKTQVFTYRDEDYRGNNEGLAAPDFQYTCSRVADSDTDPNATESSSDEMAVQMTHKHIKLMRRREFISSGLAETKQARVFQSAADARAEARAKNSIFAQPRSDERAEARSWAADALASNGAGPSSASNIVPGPSRKTSSTTKKGKPGAETTKKGKEAVSRLPPGFTGSGVSVSDPIVYSVSDMGSSK